MGSGGTLRTFNTSTLNCFGAITAKSDSVLCFQVITDITLKNIFYLLNTMYIPYPNMYVQCTHMKYSIRVQPLVTNMSSSNGRNVAHLLAL